jgi:hypothetical protein
LVALLIAASLRVLVEQLRIDLPGEQPAEDAQRTLDAEAEAVYAEQTEGYQHVRRSPSQPAWPKRRTSKVQRASAKGVGEGRKRTRWEDVSSHLGIQK